jgi:homoserine trans-succinylase
MRIVFATLLCCWAAIAAAEHYGAEIQSKTPLSLPAAIKQLDTKPSAEVLIESKVDKVCVVKGCWMALTNKDVKDEVRVTFKDYGFFVPSSIIGKTVLVEGTLEKVVMSLEDTKHYVKDAGGDPSTVTTPRTEYRIVANGVQVKS